MAVVADAARSCTRVVLGLSLVACTKDSAVPFDGPAPTPTSSTARGRAIACGPHGLPPDRHFVADGLCARVVAFDQGQLRGLTFAPNGDLFAVTLDGDVRRYRDVDHDGLFDPKPPETVVWARTNAGGHACVFERNVLYCGTRSTVKRWHWTADVDEGGAGEDVVIGLPDAGADEGHALAVAKGMLYVATSAAPRPLPSSYDLERAVVRRFPLASPTKGRALTWKQGEVVIRGIHNLSAIASDAAGRLVGIDDGAADLLRHGRAVSDEDPGAPLVLVEKDKAYGYPFCMFAGRARGAAQVPPATPLLADVPPPQPGARVTAGSAPRDDAWCQSHVDSPLALFDANSSARSILYPPGTGNFALPSRWRSGAFVALRGAPGHTHAAGHNVVWLPFDERGATILPTITPDGTTYAHEVVFGGGRYGAARDGAWSWQVGDAGDDPVRPTSLALSPIDGALFVASESDRAPRGGVVYRVALLGK
ncbi:L-sorbosone dehydrogenase [Labilithrix luteola]|uniref:L-sorbosone dehydrogenase n=1 Tax=Labilithrix luteola TaxID=1391654 RepID=A0A0K1QBP0_9BACT|nr:hypothetical protein [Labilithrix luteola]AKV02825.1 L-sorbosone dehydrogenase [Labilithrix luteola]